LVVAALPTGTVTFLFTDLEGSTRLWDEHGEEMRAALVRHDQILREAVGSHHGHVVKTTGDGAYAVFPTAHDAVWAAVDAQRAVTEEDWGFTPLRVRMGMHTGDADLREGDYFGGVLNRAARLMSLGHGGQVLMSHVTAELASDSLPVGVGLRDLGEHRLRDLSRPERVFQLLGPGCAGEFPPLRTLAGFPGNLPVQVTSFVGRSSELARVGEELAQARLVTLTGVGGVGKTRLALEVAGELVLEYRDGAWLVELAGVRDLEAVPDTLVASFGLQPRAGSSASETLLEFLRSKALLLILDNCEHLLRPVGNLVAQVMQACPAVRVLATSREALNVAGERVLGVASLDVPDDKAGLEAIAACDAVVLFVERAQAVKASFALDAANADAVAQLCRRLDGIPLATELAAARIGMLTPTELARRLDQRFRLLAGGRRSGVERHQTLRAAIDWSYELLSVAERLLLARVSVFAGGFNLEAAEAVTPGGELQADAVFEMLASLVGRYLVVAETEEDETRYRLLETIRQYAQERLEEEGDLDGWRARHAAYYTDFGESAIPNTAGLEGLMGERRVGRESENFRAALTWAIDTQETDTAVRLLGMWTANTQWLSDFRSVAAAVNWAAEAVLGLPRTAEHPGYAAALVAAAIGAWARGDLELAVQRCDDADATTQADHSDQSFVVSVTRASIALGQGRADVAVEHARQAVAMARAQGSPAGLMEALRASALAHSLAGDREGGLTDAEEILSLRHQLPLTRVVQQALCMAALALSDSEPERALLLARQVVALLGPGDTDMAYPVAGEVATRNGERHEALVYFDKAVDSVYWRGFRPGLGVVLGRVGTLLAEDNPEAAAVLFGAADAMLPGYAHSRTYVEARERATANLEASIGKPRLAQLHSQGESMTESDATRYAHAAISGALREEGS
jgi:predicted ATPase/class 3 adenylate cyclase